MKIGPDCDSVFITTKMTPLDVSSFTYEQRLEYCIQLLGFYTTKKQANTVSDIIIKYTWKDKKKDIDNIKNEFAIDTTYLLLRS